MATKYYEPEKNTEQQRYVWNKVGILMGKMDNLRKDYLDEMEDHWGGAKELIHDRMYDEAKNKLDSFIKKTKALWKGLESLKSDIDSVKKLPYK